jgi:hypothetical protein
MFLSERKASQHLQTWKTCSEDVFLLQACLAVSRDGIVAQVIEVAKKYPDIVDLQLLDGGPRPSFKSGGKNKSAG